jgi:glycosyltransferase involved in cell wall biosynthesis
MVGSLRILHAIETLAIEGGGGDRACADLAEAQAGLGHNVAVIRFVDIQKPTLLYPEGVQLIDVPRSGFAAEKLGWSRSFRRELTRNVKASDIVHCHGAWSLIQANVRRVCRKYSVPYVSQPHGSFEGLRMRHGWLRKMIWSNLFERRNLAQANAVHTEGEKDASDVFNFQPRANIFVLPCGSKPLPSAITEVDFEKSYPLLFRKRYLLYLGRLDYHKGLDTLIPVFAEVVSGKEDFTLAIVGIDYNGTRVKLERLAKKYNSARIEFYDAVFDPRIKRALFENAMAFILPSKSENFGITVIEALLCGCPVLVSKETAWADLEQQGAGIVFDPFPDSLRSAIARFLDKDEANLEEMIAKGRSVAEEFNWETIAAESISVYSRLVAGGHLEKRPEKSVPLP